VNSDPELREVPREVTRSECKEVPRQECRTVTDTQCRSVPVHSDENVCRSVPKQSCRDVTELKCRPSASAPVCHVVVELVPTEVCQPVTVPQCTETTRQDCREVPQQRCVNGPVEIPDRVCQNVPKQECVQIPVELCKDTVVGEECSEAQAAAPAIKCAPVQREVCANVPSQGRYSPNINKYFLLNPTKRYKI
jgi:hypothetical protein